MDTQEVLIEEGRKEGRKDRKSTRLNSSHLVISYAVFCLKKKKNNVDLLLVEDPDEKRKFVVRLRRDDRISRSTARKRPGRRSRTSWNSRIDLAVHRS